MLPGVLELRWAYVGLALLVVIDFLVAFLVNGPAELILLGLLFIFQVLVIWLMQRVLRIVRGYRHLKESYEQELDFARQVMDNSGQGMAVMDAQGRFAYVNASLAGFLGRPKEALLGHSPSDFLLPQDQQVFQAQLRERWTGKQNSYVLHAYHTDGHSVALQVTGTPRWHQGRIVGNFATISLHSDDLG